MPENVDLVRSILTAPQRGGYANAEWAHPGIGYVIADGPDAGVWRGGPGVARPWRDVLSAYDDFRTVVDDIREIDGDRVLVLGSYTGRGKSTRLRLAAMNASWWEISDGRVVRHVVYFNRDRALADLGLAE